MALSLFIVRSHIDLIQPTTMFDRMRKMHATSHVDDPAERPTPEELAALPSARIERFELAEPSLDDIFISVVQNKTGEAQENPPAQEKAA